MQTSLQRLTQRLAGRLPVVAPRLPSRFENEAATPVFVMRQDSAGEPPRNQVGPLHHSEPSEPTRRPPVAAPDPSSPVLDSPAPPRPAQVEPTIPQGGPSQNEPKAATGSTPKELAPPRVHRPPVAPTQQLDAPTPPSRPVPPGTVDTPSSPPEPREEAPSRDQVPQAQPWENEREKLQQRFQRIEKMVRALAERPDQEQNPPPGEAQPPRSPALQTPSRGDSQVHPYPLPVAPAAPPPAPIHVDIGTIHVRAEQPRPASSRPTPSHPPTESLASYLSRRSAGRY